jgi:hypothetical protein
LGSYPKAGQRSSQEGRKGSEERRWCKAGSEEGSCKESSKIRLKKAVFNKTPFLYGVLL